MWLRTDTGEAINTDQVKWFTLEGKRIVAGFGPIPSGETYSDVNLTVKDFPSEVEAPAALDRLLGVLGEAFSL